MITRPWPKPRYNPSAGGKTHHIFDPKTKNCILAPFWPFLWSKQVKIGIKIFYFILGPNDFQRGVICLMNKIMKIGIFGVKWLVGRLFGPYIFTKMPHPTNIGIFYHIILVWGRTRSTGSFGDDLNSPLKKNRIFRSIHDQTIYSIRD